MSKKHAFFQRALEGQNKWWSYFAGMILVSVGFSLGQTPITVILLYKIAQIAKDGEPSAILEANEKLMAYDFTYFGLSNNLSFFLILLTFVGGIAFVYLSVVKVHKRPFRSIITTERSINWKKIGFGFAVWFGITFILEAIGYSLDSDNYVWTFNWMSFIPLLIMCILLLPLQTSFEEVFMRGYLMQGIPLHPNTILISILLAGGVLHAMSLAQTDVSLALMVFGIYYSAGLIIGVLFYLEKKGKIQLGLYQLVRRPIFPLMVTSIMFGLMHGMNPEIAEFGFAKMMVFYIGMGVFLGLITLLDESLELALGIHFGNNLFGALFVSFDGSALQTPTLFRALEMNTDYMLVGWFGMVTLFMIIAQFRYKWSNWGKLFQKIQYVVPEGLEVDDIAYLNNQNTSEDVQPV